MEVTVKKIAIFFVLICSLLLTSCQVNWFGDQIDVEWWVIAVPVAIILIATWGIGGLLISKKSYICPECKKVFHPKWWKTAFSVHVGNDRVFKCPNCGRKGFCKVYKED